MTLIKTSLLNGIAVAVKVASALVLNKILAVYVGPAGYAIIGQFQNAVSIIVSIAGGLVTTGVTKTTAQHFDDEAKQHAIWQTAIRCSLIASLLAGFGLLFMSSILSEWLMHSADMASIFYWLALSLPAMAANNLLLAIVNGKKEVGIYVIANIIGSFVSMLVIGLLAFYYGLYGTLVAFTINPAIVLVTTAALVSRRVWFKSNYLWGKINRSAAQDLSGFALMAITSAMAVPITYMLIRDHLSTQLGLAAAGYWQASWKISEIYLMLVTSTLSVYYLPRLAEIRTNFELKNEVLKVYQIVLPIVMVGALIIYYLRDFIIGTLFTEDFYPMRELFLWQLTGDLIKICSWILGYILFGRGMVKLFVVKELVISMIFLILTHFFVGKFGLHGVSIAYMFTYIVNFVVLIFIVRHEMMLMSKVDCKSHMEK